MEGVCFGEMKMPVVMAGLRGAQVLGSENYSVTAGAIK